MYIKYNDSEEFIVGSVRPNTPNTVRVEGTEVNLSGFRIYLTDSDKYPLDNREYEVYTTLFRQGEGWHELSNDGSVYVEPEPEISVELTEEEIAALEVEQQKRVILTQIETLKEQLEESDYKVIKAYEYSLVAESVEYDMEAVHEERQAIREQINSLEEQLAFLA